MAANTGNIDIITNVPMEDAPSCDHGPTLLFARYDVTTKSVRHFYACAAFRDRKVCPFLQWTDETRKTPKHKNKLPDNWPTLSHKKVRKRTTIFKKLPKKQRNLCLNCGLLIMPEEEGQHQGQGHSIKEKVTKAMLQTPTQLFQPLDNNRTYAQYLFSTKTVQFVLSSLEKLGVTHVLCVGCPRIHEAVCLREKMKSDEHPTLTSLLLDLDHRYLQIYPPKKFCRYNMLNHHFFGCDEDVRTFQSFIKEQSDKKVAMVIDPPFGIMVDALAVTLDKIQTLWRGEDQDSLKQMPVLWFFPYFMEQRVLSINTNFTMLDYKVDYDNHSLFKGESGRKKGSPVRIFTNLSPRELTLPEEEGYWFCEKCNRYSSVENKHCDKCNTCPTKDGGTYRHCDICGRCVKPSRIHCYKCRLCDLQDHRCGRPRKTGCHICGEEGHKRRDCPKNKEPQSKSCTQGNVITEGDLQYGGEDTSNIGTDEQIGQSASKKGVNFSQGLGRNQPGSNKGCVDTVSTKDLTDTLANKEDIETKPNEIEETSSLNNSGEGEQNKKCKTPVNNQGILMQKKHQTLSNKGPPKIQSDSKMNSIRDMKANNCPKAKKRKGKMQTGSLASIKRMKKDQNDDNDTVILQSNPSEAKKWKKMQKGPIPKKKTFKV